MTSGNDIKSVYGHVSAWHRSAASTAVVAGVFSAIVCVFLALNYGRSRIVDTEQELKLAQLRLESQNNPDDKQILSRIRELDLKIRRQRIVAVDRSRTGGYLLLGGVAVLLISLKLCGTFSKKPPSPELLTGKPAEQIHEVTFARRAVIAGLVILGSGALLLAIRPQIEFVAATGDSESKSWPSFRGPGGLGISNHTNVPVKWDGSTGEGILWKTKVPLPGHNSPVVFGDRVFLSGGDPNELAVFCFDANSGRLLWTGDVTRVSLKEDEEPIEPMEDTGFAASTVATDGKRVYAIFVTGDVGCFDFNGNKVWEKHLGIPDSAYGYASSLAVYRNLLLIQFDQGGVEDEKSVLMAVNGFSGEIAWQTKRPVGNSWSSPTVVNMGEQTQILTCADPWVIAYDPANGTEIWRANCLVGDIAPSQIYASGLVFVIEPYSKLVAIRADGRGDVTETHIAWSMDEGGPDICSPVSDGERIYMLGSDGLLSCFKVSDGAKVWEQDLREFFLASPSLVGDRLYLLTEKGVMFIAQVGAEYKELAKCELGEKCHASPAFADGRIYIRGVEHLYCIGGQATTEP